MVDDRLIHRRVIWDPTPIPHLPMAIHVNNWLSRSTQLAGRINNRRLLATTMVRAIVVEANVVASSALSDDLYAGQVRPCRMVESHLAT